MIEGKYTKWEMAGAPSHKVMLALKQEWHTRVEMLMLIEELMAIRERVMEPMPRSPILITREVALRIKVSGLVAGSAGGGGGGSSVQIYNTPNGEPFLKEVYEQGSREVIYYLL